MQLYISPRNLQPATTGVHWCDLGGHIHPSFGKLGNILMRHTLSWPFPSGRNIDHYQKYRYRHMLSSHIYPNKWFSAELFEIAFIETNLTNTGGFVLLVNSYKVQEIACFIGFPTRVNLGEGDTPLVKPSCRGWATFPMAASLGSCCWSMLPTGIRVSSFILPLCCQSEPT